MQGLSASAIGCSRKRSQTPTSESLPNDVDRRPRKKPKHLHPSRPPPRFWDNLSKTPLIRDELGEVNRRNAPASAYLEESTPAHLRRTKRFSWKGGPDLSDLRGFRNVSQSSLGRRKRDSQLPTKCSSNTASTKSTGPYDRALQQHSIDHSVFPHRYEYPDGGTPPPPDNLEEIRAVLAQSRPSLSLSRFTNEDFKKFEKEDAHPKKEWKIFNVVPIIEGDVADRKCVSGQIPFNNLDHLTDNSLVSGFLDRYYVACP
ncbi:hypothetical protein PG985_016196 [Apiospora marii]|uniref:uncharacterized protein n=1 Tax=Apiospora marii TaxID=335849 RepID=UPI00312EDB9D